MEQQKTSEFVDLLRASLAQGNVSASQRKCSQCEALIPLFVEAQGEQGQPYFVDAIEHMCFISPPSASVESKNIIPIAWGIDEDE